MQNIKFSSLIFIFVLLVLSNPSYSQNNSKDFLNAVMEGNVELVETFIEKGADVNMKIDDRFTPLIYAIYANHFDVVKLLASKGADVNLHTEKGGTALNIAASKGNQNICSFL